MAQLELRHISVSYEPGVDALKDVSLTVDRGERVAVIGTSGSGKSTLLKAINLLQRPRTGEVVFDGRDLCALNKHELREARKHIGFVFQDYNLIDRLTVLENVLLGRLGHKNLAETLFNRYTDKEYDSALLALKHVNLTEKRLVRADELSGGQKQRVAIAKTLCQRPELILADEPVSSLDRATARTVMDIFQKVNEKKNITLIINLHDVQLAVDYCPRIVALKHGEKIFDGPREDLTEKILKDIYES